MPEQVQRQLTTGDKAFAVLQVDADGAPVGGGGSVTIVAPVETDLDGEASLRVRTGAGPTWTTWSSAGGVAFSADTNLEVVNPAADQRVVMVHRITVTATATPGADTLVFLRFGETGDAMYLTGQLSAKGDTVVFSLGTGNILGAVDESLYLQATDAITATWNVVGSLV